MSLETRVAQLEHEGRGKDKRIAAMESGVFNKTNRFYLGNADPQEDPRLYFVRHIHPDMDNTELYFTVPSPTSGERHAISSGSGSSVTALTTRAFVIHNYAASAATGHPFTVNNTGWTDIADEGGGLLYQGGHFDMGLGGHHRFALYGVISTGTGSLRLQDVDTPQTIATISTIPNAAAVPLGQDTFTAVPDSDVRVRLEGRGTAASSTLTIYCASWWVVL